MNNKMVEVIERSLQNYGKYEIDIDCGKITFCPDWLSKLLLDTQGYLRCKKVHHQVLKYIWSRVQKK